MRTTLLFAVLAAGLAIPAAAQTQAPAIQVGKWTGSVTPPEEGTVDVTYDVTLKGDTIGITLDVAEHGSFVMEDVKLADGKLTFHFTPGPVVNCILESREDGGYGGECTDSEGGVATMLMLPPKKEG